MFQTCVLRHRVANRAYQRKLRKREDHFFWKNPFCYYPLTASTIRVPLELVSLQGSLNLCHFLSRANLCHFTSHWTLCRSVILGKSHWNLCDFRPGSSLCQFASQPFYVRLEPVSFQIPLRSASF